MKQSVAFFPATLITAPGGSYGGWWVEYPKGGNVRYMQTDERAVWKVVPSDPTQPAWVSQRTGHARTGECPRTARVYSPVFGWRSTDGDPATECMRQPTAAEASYEDEGAWTPALTGEE